VLALNKVDRLDTDPGASGGPARRRRRLGGRGNRHGRAPGRHRAGAAGGCSVTLRIPHADGTALGLCYERGRVHARRDGPGYVVVDADLRSGSAEPGALPVAASPSVLGMVD
jgi:hypothetical protein